MMKVHLVLKYLSIFSFFMAVTSYGARLEDTLLKIQKRGELRVGLEAGYLPFEMRDKRGKIIGFDIDLAKLMAKSMGVKLKVVNTEWDGIIPALLTDKFDIIMGGMTITPARNMKINFSDPYIVIGQTMIIKKELEGVIKSYKDINDLKYKVASKLGTTGEQAIKRLLPKAQYKSYQGNNEAALEVVSGRVDAFVYDKPFNAVFVARQGDGKVIFLDETFTYEPLGLGIRRNDPSMLNFLNNFLKQIKNDGRYDKLYRRWFVDMKWLRNVQ
jgi:polar amino acid transport system substrate-binding protein